MGLREILSEGVKSVAVMGILFGPLVCPAVYFAYDDGQQIKKIRQEERDKWDKRLSAYQSTYSPSAESEVMPLRKDFVRKCLADGPGFSSTYLAKLVAKRENVAERYQEPYREQWLCWEGSYDIGHAQIKQYR